MNSTPPFIAQEKSNTCALACLRMILAHRGRAVEESELTEKVAIQPDGLSPEDVAQLARQFGLPGQELQLDLASLVAEVQGRRFPIVILYRLLLDGKDAVHAVIPIRFTRHYVMVLDPLRGLRRISIRKFEAARRRIGQWVVVWNEGG
jgi:ABC-type bacteriocin/lantibiotic exporter with double-glycine peptidase domain